MRKSPISIGDRFGHLIVTGEKYQGKLIKWICKCDCGNTYETTSHNLIHGYKVSCGCVKSDVKYNRSSKEIDWTDVKRYPHLVVLSDTYFIFDCGEVYSNYKGLHRLQPRIHSNGYVRTLIFGKDIYVHRLVATAFIPNPDNLREVNHKDCNKRNNDVSNLEWVTRQQNCKHAYDSGCLTHEHMVEMSRTFQALPFCPNEILSESDALNILIRKFAGEYSIYIAREYDISRQAIDSIARGNTYARVYKRFVYASEDSIQADIGTEKV